ncbi:Transcription factor CBF/NF-Y/archaeal histone domain [Dillenia turbinata]|uniref:Transcription factor CBF/NF-Y/archaeal histone domain n=1 Tax=Dillenia turbinata TaxID=194707 RepID=A0AAN8V7Z5_9MAGN
MGFFRDVICVIGLTQLVSESKDVNLMKAVHWLRFCSLQVKASSNSIRSAAIKSNVYRFYIFDCIGIDVGFGVDVGFDKSFSFLMAKKMFVDGEKYLYYMKILYLVCKILMVTSFLFSKVVINLHGCDRKRILERNKKQMESKVKHMCCFHLLLFFLLCETVQVATLPSNSLKEKALSIPLNSASMSGKTNQSSPVRSPLSGNLSDSSSKEQDRFLPVAYFISFITGEASDKCQREKRKTINGDDLLLAMTTLGFENYIGPLKVYLNKYTETVGEKNSLARQEEQSYSTIAVSPFNDGYYPIATQVTSRGFGDGGRIIRYGEYFAVGGFTMSKIHEHGGNGKLAMAAHLHHGVEW